MPSIKLLIDDELVYESTSIPNISDPTITMNDLQEIGNPEMGRVYYYISPDGKKIYQGTLVVNNRFGYTMRTENNNFVVDKIYVRKILKKGGKRKSRRTRKSKRSTRRRK